MRSRIKAAEKEEQEQAKEIAQLRARSAHILQRWYEVSVLAGNECWVEWEGRCEEVERMVRRKERAEREELKEKDMYVGGKVSEAGG